MKKQILVAAIFSIIMVLLTALLIRCEYQLRTFIYNPPSTVSDTIYVDIPCTGLTCPSCDVQADSSEIVEVDMSILEVEPKIQFNLNVWIADNSKSDSVTIALRQQWENQVNAARRIFGFSFNTVRLRSFTCDMTVCEAYDMPDERDEVLRELYDERFINVAIWRSLDGCTIGGFANIPPPGATDLHKYMSDNWIHLGGSVIHPLTEVEKVFGHELGHFLGEFHTFDPRYPDPAPRCNYMDYNDCGEKNTPEQLARSTNAATNQRNYLNAAN